MNTFCLPLSSIPLFNNGVLFYSALLTTTELFFFAALTCCTLPLPNAVKLHCCTMAYIYISKPKSPTKSYSPGKCFCYGRGRGSEKESVERRLAWPRASSSYFPDDAVRATAGACVNHFRSPKQSGAKEVAFWQPFPTSSLLSLIILHLRTISPSDCHIFFVFLFLFNIRSFLFLHLSLHSFFST